MAICFVAFLPLMAVRHLVLVTIPTVLALPRAARAGEGVPCAPFAQEDPPEPTLRTAGMRSTDWCGSTKRSRTSPTRCFFSAIR